MKRITTMLVMAVIVCSGIGFAGALKMEDLSETDRETLLKFRDEKVRQRILEAMGKFNARYKDREKQSQEWALRRTMTDDFLAWERTGSDVDAAKCDNSITALLDSEPTDMRSYFCAAQFAFLREDDDGAISILERAIAMSPDAKSPMANLPVSIVGRLWIGTMQRYVDQAEQAVATYESLRQAVDPNSAEGRVVWAICSLYLSELAGPEKENDARSLAELDRIRAIKAKDAGRSYDSVDLYRSWASYKRNRRTQGPRNASTALEPSAGPAPYVAIGHLRTCGLLPDDAALTGNQHRIIRGRLFDRICKNAPSAIDKSLFHLVLGFTNASEKDFAVSDTHFAALFEEDTFFSPVAGLLLAGTKRQRQKQSEADAVLDKIKSRYPGYADFVEKAKNKWKK